MFLNMHMLLSFMFQSLNSQQKEGVGNLLAIGLLALFVVILITIGIRIKSKSQQPDATDVKPKAAPLKETSEASSKKKALM